MIDNSVVSVEPAEAEAMLREAAASGDLDAMTVLGCWRELHGEHAEAVQIYQAAAQKGHAGAARQMWLHDVRHLKPTAGSHRRAAAVGGDDLAARCGRLNELQAEELSRAISEPVYRYLSEQYERAAQAGDADAMRKLGRLAEERGELLVAAGWFSQAAEVSGDRNRARLSKAVSKAFEEAPPDVQAVATEHGIASSYFMYEVGAGRAGVAGVGGVIGAVLLGLSGMVMAAGGYMTGVFAVIAALIVGVGSIMSSVSVVSSTGERVYLFDGGFVYAGGADAARAFTWDQISVLHDIRSTRAGVVSTHCRYTVIRRDGARVMLESDKFPGVATFGPEIQKRLTETQYPSTIEAIRAGQTIGFGPITVDVDGISTGDGTTPWNEVEKVSYENGRVSVKPIGRRSWAIGVGVIPNFFVFVAVVAALRQTVADRS